MIRKSSSSTGRTNRMESSGKLGSLKDIADKVHVGEVIPARILRAASENMYLIHLLGKQMLAESHLKFSNKKILVKIESKKPKLHLKLLTDNNDSLSKAVNFAHQNGIGYFGGNAEITDFVLEHFGTEANGELINLLNIGNAVYHSDIIPLSAILESVRIDRDMIGKLAGLYSKKTEKLSYRYNPEYEDLIRYFFMKDPCPSNNRFLQFLELMDENNILMESQSRIDQFRELSENLSYINNILKSHDCCYTIVWVVTEDSIAGCLTENNINSSQCIYESEIYEGIRLRLDSRQENLLTIGVTNSYAMRYYKELSNELLSMDTLYNEKVDNCRFTYDIIKGD